MVNFTDMADLQFVHFASVYSRNNYDQVHVSDVVNANAFPHAGDPLPDTFKDGAQCLVEGKVQPDGRFVAETVQAKCASKYEAAPGGQSQPGSTSDSSYPNGKS